MIDLHSPDFDVDSFLESQIESNSQDFQDVRDRLEPFLSKMSEQEKILNAELEDLKKRQNELIQVCNEDVNENLEKLKRLQFKQKELFSTLLSRSEKSQPVIAKLKSVTNDISTLNIALKYIDISEEIESISEIALKSIDNDIILCTKKFIRLVEIYDKLSSDRSFDLNKIGNNDESEHRSVCVDDTKSACDNANFKNLNKVV